jgi:hypothetical protein
MSRRGLIALVVLACGGPQQEAPPPYTPTNSPEAETSCPDAAAAAKAAREEAMEHPDKKGEAAQAVFTLAECEKGQLDKVHISRASVEVYLAEVSAARQVFETVRNLYEEVLNYGNPLWTLAATVRLGDIRLDYAKKIEASRPRELSPQDVEQITGVLRVEAATSYRSGLRMGKTAGDDESQKWAKAACEGLLSTQPGASCD